MKSTFYIAYGSNLNTQQMAYRCPTAEAVGIDMLDGYQLIFNGVATLIPEANSSVPIVIWKIDKACEMALDKYEGVPRLYRKEYLPINIKGEKRLAMIYLMNDFRPALPNKSYLDVIKQGYHDFGLDHAFLSYSLIYTSLLAKGAIEYP